MDIQIKEIFWNSLNAKLAGQDITLAEYLISNGVFSADEYENAKKISEYGKTEISILPETDEIEETEEITTAETTVLETTTEEAVTTTEATAITTTTEAETTTIKETATKTESATTTIVETTTAETTTTSETTTATEATTVENTEKKYIALTFDDGPNTTTTNEVLDVLEQYGITASFFLVGNNINSSTESVVKRAYDMGCEIGNHSKTHSYMNEMTAEEIIDEIQYVNEYVERITGEAPVFFRPPYIAVSNIMYEEIDMPFICGFGCNDWDDKVTVEKRYKYIIKQAEDGGIILLHDAQGNSKTVEALHTIIPELQAQGYEFVTVSELFEIKGVEIKADDLNLYSYVGRKFG